MARNRTPQTFEKRLRERDKQVKRQAKQADRLARKSAKRAQREAEGERPPGAPVPDMAIDPELASELGLDVPAGSRPGSGSPRPRDPAGPGGDVKPAIQRAADAPPEIKRVADAKPEIKRVEDAPAAIKRSGGAPTPSNRIADAKPEVQRSGIKQPDAKP